MSTTTRLGPAELRAAVPALSTLSDEEIAPLFAQGEVRTYADGETIFSEGQPARALYFVVSGTVHIHRKGQGSQRIDLADFPTGSIFGEVALLARTERTATACAKGAVVALRVIGEPLYEDYRDGNRYSQVILLRVARLLAERLEAMNRRLVEALAPRKGGELETFREKMFQDWTV
jgi:glutaminase